MLCNHAASGSEPNCLENVTAGSHTRFPGSSPGSRTHVQRRVTGLWCSVSFGKGFVGTSWPRVPTVLTILSCHQDAVTAEEIPGPVHTAPARPLELSKAEGARARPAGSPA